MKKQSFPFPMLKMEKIFGWLYLPIHIFVLPFAVSYFCVLFAPSLGFKIDDAHINLIYYVISFTFVLIFMFRYLRATFGDLCDNFWTSVKTLILGYVFYYILAFAVSIILTIFISQPTNPNTADIVSSTKLNVNVMTVVAVLLGPVVEEALFRGVVFGNIRQKNRVAAYIVSTLVFAIYHLWQYLLFSPDWTILLYLLQYIPASVALAWSYENSKNLWVPIFIHMLINFVALSVSLA